MHQIEIDLYFEPIFSLHYRMLRTMQKPTM